jgi:selenocysteine-specific elongation factor
MHVIATAGHVDHGKSTLVKALTGTDPDRLEEEHRRGLSIELGYCWTQLGPAGDIAFVDVPGHERFLPTMLAGVGPVPAVLFVVAADDPWMPQATEHLAALDALGVCNGVVAVTRSDLADPAPARDRAAAKLSVTTLRDAPLVNVSGRTGQGLDELRSELVAMVMSLPPADERADVRLWVDRRFTMKGAGTVVTGTLQAGRICTGDTLSTGSTGGSRVRVRELQALGKPVSCASGVSRLALNLTGVDQAALARGSVLVTPEAFCFTDVADIRVVVSDRKSSDESPPPPKHAVLHIGAAAVPVTYRPLGGDSARLTLDRGLPLRIGDRALLRDPGSRRLWGATVLDPAPPPFTRRGAPAIRASQLASVRLPPDLESEVERRGLVHAELLRRIGVNGAAGTQERAGTGGWLLSSARAREVAHAIERLVDDHDRRFPLDPGVPLQTMVQKLGLPSAELVRNLVPSALTVTEGRVRRPQTALPVAVESAVTTLGSELADAPFAAPTADRLRELGLDHKATAAAAKAGRLLRLADGVVLLPGADRLAASYLSELPQPFTPSEARQRLATTRRVVLPLLEHLDRHRLTTRLPDDRRTTATPPG